MTRALRRIEDMEHAVGTDGTLALPLYDGSGDELDVTGLTAEWRLFRAEPRRRHEPFTGGLLASKTSAAGQIALTEGLAAVTVLDTDFDSLKGRYWQMIRLTETASGDIVEYASGFLHLRADWR